MPIPKFTNLSKRGLLRGNRFSTNTNYKFSKFHKICPRTFNKFTLSSSSKFLVSYPIFVVPYRMDKFVYFSDSQLKSFKLSFRKPYSKLFRLHVRPYFGISKRPAEVRMGKGKSGKISYRAYPFKPGTYVGFVPSRSSPSITTARSFTKMLHPASKLPFRSLISDLVFLHTPLLRFMVYVNSKLFIFDNSGAKRGRCIRTPFKHIPAELGSVVLLSILVKDINKRKIRVGQIHRAVVITRGFKTRRLTGHEASFINAVVILKKNDNVPLSKRVKGPVCVELRRKKMTKILTMGPFAY